MGVTCVVWCSCFSQGSPSPPGFASPGVMLACILLDAVGGGTFSHLQGWSGCFPHQATWTSNVISLFLRDLRLETCTLVSLWLTQTHLLCPCVWLAQASS